MIFGLPSWAITVIVMILRECGLIDWSDALIVKGVTRAEAQIGKLKTYHSQADFPHGRNGQ